MSTQPVIIQQKSNGLFSTGLKLIGLVCLLCCLSSMWSSYTAAKAVGNAVSNIELTKMDDAEKPKVVIDMLDVSTQSSIETIVESESEPVPMSTKTAKLLVYPNSDCTGETFTDVTLDEGSPLETVGTTDMSAEPKETVYACCVKTENMNVTGTFFELGETGESIQKDIEITEDGDLDLSKVTSDVVQCPYKYKFNWKPRE